MTLPDGRQIWLLDTHYLSNIAKAQTGVRIKEDDRIYFLELLASLRSAVKSNRVACPYVSHIGWEIVLDTRIAEGVRMILSELNGGFAFKDWRTILNRQIEHSAERFLNPKAVSSVVKNLDAITPISVVWRNMGDLSSSKFDSIRIARRQRKTKRVTEMKQILERTHDLVATSLEEEIRRQKTDFVDAYIGRARLDQLARIRQLSNPLDLLEYSVDYKPFAKLRENLKQKGIVGEKVPEFLTSAELFATPYIDVLCSIYSAIVFHYPARKVKQSDSIDVDMLAVAVASCDVVTTDIFMKEILVKRLEFDKKYAVTILDGSRRDRMDLLHMARDSLAHDDGRGKKMGSPIID